MDFQREIYCGERQTNPRSDRLKNRSTNQNETKKQNMHIYIYIRNSFLIFFHFIYGCVKSISIFSRHISVVKKLFQSNFTPFD